MTATASGKSQPSEAVSRQAAEWVARRHGGLRSGEVAELEAWLNANPEHAAAFEEQAAAWAFVNRPREAGRADIIRTALAAHDRRKAKKKTTAWTLAIVGLAAAAVFAVMMPRVGTTVQSPTISVRPDVQSLADGSKIELYSTGQVEVNFSPAERNVRLLAGEAMFMVAKDPGRPFLVTAGNVQVRAVGTAFSVRHAKNEINVLVTEGTVQLRRISDGSTGSDGSRDMMTLVAGQSAAIFAGMPIDASSRVVTVSQTEIARALAWRGKRVEFTDTPLAQAITVFNQSNQIQISLADSSLDDRRITGIFWADNPDGFVRLLESGVNVSVQRSANQIILRSR